MTIISSIKSSIRVGPLLVAGFLAAAPLAMTPAFAYDPNSTAAVNVDASGLALRGHDPVAYFTAGKPTPGKAELTEKFEGATYRFSSAANQALFKSNPAKYAPAYGGHCAMGASLGKKLDGNPAIWRIVDNRLYLNVAPPAFKRWQEDIPGNIKKANENWPSIQAKAPKDL